MKESVAFRLYLASLIMFGMNGVIAAQIHGLDSTQIVLFRTVLGCVVFLGALLVASGRVSFRGLGEKRIPLIVSGISMGFCWMFLYESYSQIGVGITSLLYCCGPAVLMVASSVIFGEKVTVFKVIGMVLVISGAVLLSVHDLGSGGSVWGYFCGIMSAATYAVTIVMYKKADVRSGFEAPALQLVSTFVTVLIYNMVTMNLPGGILVGDILPILVLGLVNTGCGVLMYFVSIPFLQAQTVAICDYVESGSAVLFATVFLSEPLGLVKVLGIVLIVAGIMVGEVLGRRMAEKRRMLAESSG